MRVSWCTRPHPRRPRTRKSRAGLKGSGVLNAGRPDKVVRHMKWHVAAVMEYPTSCASAYCSCTGIQDQNQYLEHLSAVHGYEGLVVEKSEEEATDEEVPGIEHHDDDDNDEEDDERPATPPRSRKRKPLATKQRRKKEDFNANIDPALQCMSSGKRVLPVSVR